MQAQFQIWAAPSLPGIAVLVGMIGIWMVFDGRRRLGWLLVALALLASGILAIEEARDAIGVPARGAPAHEVSQPSPPPGVAAAPVTVEPGEAETSQESPLLILP